MSDHTPQQQSFIARDVHADFNLSASFSERLADRIAELIGSWPFIILQSILLLVWIVLNTAGWILQWDPYPFILMNLVLSTQAAFTAPIIMMSQNRQSAKDRLVSQHDFEVNRKAEHEIRHIMLLLEKQTQTLEEMRVMLNEKQNG